MIRFVRSVRPCTGKGREALELAKEITAYLNKRDAGGEQVQIGVEIFGESGTIRFIRSFSDVAALDNQLEKNLADQALQAIVRKAAGVFADGSLHDTVIRLV